MRHEIWSRGFASPGRRRVPGRVAALLCAALVLAGCRLDLVTEVEVAADGTGTVALDVTFDREMLAELDALGVDPSAELEAAAAATTGWDVRRLRNGDGDLALRIVHELADATDLGPVLRDLSAGLAPGDPGMFVDVEVELVGDGAVLVAGEAAFRAPATTGLEVDDTPLGPSGAPLAELVAGAVDAQLRIGFPGEVVEHDGDRVVGRTVTWELPVGRTVAVGARSAAPPWWAPLLAWASAVPLAAVVGAVALIVVLGLAGTWRRRSLRRAG